MKKLFLAMTTVLLALGSCSTQPGEQQETAANTADN